MAFFMAILIRPLFRFYRKKGLGSGASISLVVITTILILIGLIILLTHSISLIQSSLSVYTDAVRESITQISQNLKMDENTAESLTQNISPNSIGRFISMIAGNLGNLMLYFIVVPVLALLILLQMDSIPESVSRKMITANPKLVNLSKFADSMIIYVVGRFKINLVTGLLFTISLLIFNIDFPFFWGVMTVFLSFIPYLGIILAAAPPVIIAFVDQGALTAAAVLGSVILINLFAENVLDPIVQGKGNKLSPAVVIISVIFWGWILGAVGMILAAPLTVLLKLILSEYQETSWVAQIIEGDFSSIPSKSKSTTSKFKRLTKNITSRINVGK